MGIASSADIGRMIRRYRQDAGLSQEKLAEMVGVSSQQQQKYEAGHTTLNILKLQQIAEALKITVADLFEAKATQQARLTGEEEQLLLSFRKIKNAEMRNCILKLVSNVNKRIR